MNVGDDDVEWSEKMKSGDDKSLMKMIMRMRKHQRVIMKIWQWSQ